ncbi:phospholipase A and acyltransferase 2-like [Suncus etruscus]|uniref:phospholipase A and acyltransferase 2-like n=1 Tax=Suncus etruscus TaxID=109475 RepID=UPI00210F9643|nr:phospholipase A and acyltransferase 2-like [Suncus etruscus]
MDSNGFGPQPKAGDLIEFSRGPYEHWGVYVGDDHVVHLSDVDAGSSGINLMGSASGRNTRAVVRKDLLSNVANGGSYRINNKYVKKMQRPCAKDAVQRAEALVGKEMPYNVTSQNCEHFVTKLCYGVPMSEQVEENAPALFLIAGAVLRLLAPFFSR